MVVRPSEAGKTARRGPKPEAARREGGVPRYHEGRKAVPLRAFRMERPFFRAFPLWGRGPCVGRIPAPYEGKAACADRGVSIPLMNISGKAACAGEEARRVFSWRRADGHTAGPLDSPNGYTNSRAGALPARQFAGPSASLQCQTSPRGSRRAERAKRFSFRMDGMTANRVPLPRRTASLMRPSGS